MSESPAIPTLGLCMIVRDVAPYISKCLASVIDQIDELSIVDTGSKDDSLEIIQEIVDMRSSNGRPFTYRLNHFNVETNPESFIHDAPATFENIEGAPPSDSFSGKIMLADYAKARQLSWNVAQSDYLMWIDSDDIVVGSTNLPIITTKMRQENIESTLMTYDYEEDDEGRIVNKLLRTRILKRGAGAFWNHPIHETIGPINKIDIVDEEFIKIVHQAKHLEGKQSHRVPLRNYKVLVWQMHQITKRGETFHPRLWFYLGNETRPHNPDKALSYLQKYIDVGDWDEERSLAHIYIGQIYEAKGKLDDAAANYAAASAIFEKPESFFGLARMSYYKQDWKECVRQHEKGRKALREVRDVLHSNPLDRYYYPAIIAGRAYVAVGDYKKAHLNVEDGLKHAPRDLNLLGAKVSIEAHLQRNQRKLDIIIHCGRSLEQWNAETPKKSGLGGSETAAVSISRALAKRGHRVRVYCHCQDISGTFEGVEYIPFDKFDPKKMEIVDAFITSRRVATLIEGDLKARLKILWMHDTGIGAPVVPTAKGLLAADMIFCVSKWHKALVESLYTFVKPISIVATRNGIDPTLFYPQIENLPPKKNKLIYSSSFDRGLDMALHLFPKIREQVKDAELHVFYGFDTVNMMIERMPPEKAEKTTAAIKKIKDTAEATEGVFLRGRVSQEQLAMEMLEAKALFYPTQFSETSCITTLEAQAAACTPITSALAALNESVHHGFLIKPPTSEEKQQETFVSRAIWCLTNETTQPQLARTGRKNALSFHPWDNVAKEWEEILCNKLAENT
jgi:glycosyltransferase involved in cell wall biosynthesis